MILGFILGCYATGAGFTFLFVLFFCTLGGDNSDLWRPFAYATLWPVMLPLFLAGRA